ncbi:MAG: hypothetical protein HQL17_02150 [Candidatus Omnitrophica bacterium]|nr:hypothetical protein [Candidatus Omnitrophota bacterium]
MPDMPDTSSARLYEFVDLLSKAAREMLQVKGNFDVSRKPVIVDKEVVSFHGRMRIDGLEKFNRRTVFSVVKFYTDAAHMERDRPVGALTVFVETEHLPKLLWSLEYPRIDEDDDEAMLDGCGTLTNLIAGYYVKEIFDQGYVHLQMSHFESYINTAVNGIAFSVDQTKKCEISFIIQGQKRIVVELTMSNVPRA